MSNKKMIYLAYEYGYLSKLEVLKIINMSNYGKLTCEICKQTLGKPSIDHILPKSKGGRNQLDNLRLTHTDCNNVRMSKFTLKEKLQLIFV